jgi:hypothetical protein
MDGFSVWYWESPHGGKGSVHAMSDDDAREIVMHCTGAAPTVILWMRDALPSEVRP